MTVTASVGAVPTMSGVVEVFVGELGLAEINARTPLGPPLEAVPDLSTRSKRSKAPAQPVLPRTNPNNRRLFVRLKPIPLPQTFRNSILTLCIIHNDRLIF